MQATILFIKKQVQDNDFKILVNFCSLLRLISCMQYDEDTSAVFSITSFTQIIRMLETMLSITIFPISCIHVKLVKPICHPKQLYKSTSKNCTDMSNMIGNLIGFLVCINLESNHESDQLGIGFQKHSALCCVDCIDAASWLINLSILDSTANYLRPYIITSILRRVMF